jgi:hypothetical protein
MRWAKGMGVKCAKRRVGADLECSDVEDQLVPIGYRGVSIGSLWLNFGRDGTLILVTTVRRHPSPELVNKTFAALRDDLAERARPPFLVTGDASPAVIGSGLLHQASVEYRFRDYYALARETNMGDGFVLTEEYRSLPN